MGNDPVAELLVAIAAQDRAAFRQLYSNTSAKLMGILVRMLGTTCEAEDALQEVFTRVWLKASQFDLARGRGMTWLIAVARNHAISKLRLRPQAIFDSEAIDELVDPTASVETRMIAMGEVGRIQNCLSCLTPDRAAMLRGAYVHGHSYQDLARCYDMPLNTVRTILRRSLHKVRECMTAITPSDATPASAKDC